MTQNVTDELIMETERWLRDVEQDIEIVEGFRQRAMNSRTGDLYSVTKLEYRPNPLDAAWGAASDAAHVVVRDLAFKATQLREQMVSLRQRRANEIRRDAEKAAREVEIGGTVGQPADPGFRHGMLFITAQPGYDPTARVG